MTKQHIHHKEKTKALAIMENFELKNKKVVILEKPILRGETEIKEVELLEPTIRSMKGLRVLDLLQMDVEAYGTLLPRITNPSLTLAELSELSSADFISLCTECVSFFAKEKAVMEA